MLVSTNDSVHVNVAMYKLYENDTEKLLVVKFDEKVAFHDHIYDICKKAGRKISAVARMHGNCEETHLINVSCCLVWMSYGFANNNKINRLHERCLQ